MDAVTGATYSANAIRAILNQSGRRFAALLQVRTLPPAQTEIIPENEVPPPGGPQDIDTKTYQQLQKEKKLSTRRALYWQPQP